MFPQTLRYYRTPFLRIRVLSFLHIVVHSIHRQKYATEEVDGSPGQLTLQDHLLFKMAKSRVLQAVGEIRREVISFREKVQLNSSNLHFNSPEAVNQELMWDIASSLTYLLEVTYASGSDLEEAHLENTTEFAVFCIEVKVCFCRVNTLHL